VLVVCTGTATEVGKTWVGASVLATLRSAGIAVTARKPAQSFEPADDRPTDADLLAAATSEDPKDVCPPRRWYPVPMAPPMAAAVLHRPPFGIADLVAELKWPELLSREESSKSTVHWIETVGGVRSPLADDGDTVDLCDALSPELVVLVADAGLGTINAVLLSVAALADHQMVTVLNHYDKENDLHRRNLDWLARRGQLDVVTGPTALADRLIAHSSSSREV
jgi:dethiobiotin synthetase